MRMHDRIRIDIPASRQQGYVDMNQTTGGYAPNQHIE